MFGDEFSTHYVAIAYVLRLEQALNNLPLNDQHKEYKWFDVNALLIDGRVHNNTKRYFEQK